MCVCYFYPIFSHVYVHGSLTQTCVRALAISLKLPTGGSGLYKKPSQKQRCRWDNAEVALTQRSDYAMLTEHWTCQVSFWQCGSCSGDGEVQQPEPAGTFDAEDCSVTGFSKWKLNQQSSGERLFDTGERLFPTSPCSLTGHFGSLPFS